jgi:hypothetical protein
MDGSRPDTASVIAVVASSSVTDVRLASTRIIVMTTDTQTAPTAPEPARARAVFSSEDFGLLRTAVLSHLRTIEDDPESVKYSNLYHRLGRLG